MLLTHAESALPSQQVFKVRALPLHSVSSHDQLSGKDFMGQDYRAQ